MTLIQRLQMRRAGRSLVWVESGSEFIWEDEEGRAVNRRDVAFFAVRSLPQLKELGHGSATGC